MEAPQKRAREDAATERPSKKYKCDPSLDTAAKQQDLSALSKPELRALVASARALARRADGEIAARQASFPRCLPPQFVMSWLPLGDLPCALRVSKAWHGASEALFQIVFRENGLVDRVGTWRESVFSYAREIRWAGSQPSYYPWKELNGPTTVTNREKTLMYFRGRAIRLWPGCKDQPGHRVLQAAHLESAREPRKRPRRNHVARIRSQGKEEDSDPV